MRKLSDYEKTHLLRFGKGAVTLEEIEDKPVEYVTGKVEFCGKVFTVNQDVLIPRVETEELVTHVAETTHKLSKKYNWESARLIDVGTGSGALGICISNKLAALDQPHQMVLTDVSAAALKVAEVNVEHTATEPQSITILKSDLLKDVSNDRKFHAMVANLPYIPSARLPYLDESVSKYEPTLALDGGTEGNSLICTFLKQAPNYLHPRGIIFLELDYTHQLEELLTSDSPLTGQIIRDQFNRRRFAQLWFAETPPLP